MGALNRRLLALEASAKPVAGYSQEDDDTLCLARAERLERLHAECLARDEPELSAEELARQRRELKELVQRLRAES